MPEFENVRNEIPTYVVDRLESEWRLMQPQDTQMQTSLKTAAPQNAASTASDALGASEQ